MKRTFQLVLVLAACFVVAGTPSAWASCPGLDTQAVRHNGIGGVIAGCKDDLPISGYIYSIATPGTIHSNGQQFVCTDGGVTFPDTFLPCNLVPECGAAGDGFVTLYYEFGQGNLGSVGCPNPGGLGVDGTNPLAVHIVCNDGASVLYNVGYSTTWSGYNLDGAGPADGSFVQAGFGNGPSLTSLNAGPSPSADNVCVNVPHPAAVSDCDPGAADISTCPDPGARPALVRGKLYTRESPCGSSPDPRTTGWVALPTLPDAAGDACNLITRPTTAGQCAFVGATGTFGTVETPAVIGWFQVAGPAAANDRVKIDKAAFTQGKLVVAFSTINETSIVGFNVYSGAQKLNGNLITAKGAGSNAYNFEVGRGALKGGKSVLVEAVKSDGSVEKTAPVTLK